ncbi:DUF2189 domain-containing protein [Aestuariispira insulae]|uniref:Putative membrane protein n=1 Tax=Aestuariispira insulae TaxID=1461337 RepID=A0A3D9HV34_9PROT|nr:DUF2189 domain-containing protein [Aestuariispira insulae]RED53358.1 putative membrane protein [Aestuariispira insulae]
MGNTIVNAGRDYESYHVVDPGAIGRWLSAGWADYKKASGISIFYGLIFTVAGFAATFGLYLADLLPLILPLAGALMLLGPLMAIGMYDTARRFENGQEASLGSALDAWKTCPNRLAITGIYLMLFYVALSWFSFILFIGVMGQSNISVENLYSQILTTEAGQTFLFLEALLGIFICGVAFMTTVVAVPMFLDKGTDAFMAIKTSIRVCMDNKATMAAWALTIVILMGIAIGTAFIGLIIVMPLLGYASWHAYRELVPH